MLEIEAYMDFRICQNSWIELATLMDCFKIVFSVDIAQGPHSKGSLITYSMFLGVKYSKK